MLGPSITWTKLIKGYSLSLLAYGCLRFVLHLWVVHFAPAALFGPAPGLGGGLGNGGCGDLWCERGGGGGKEIAPRARPTSQEGQSCAVRGCLHPLPGGMGMQARELQLFCPTCLCHKVRGSTYLGGGV